jgi:hypothetical protein
MNFASLYGEPSWTDGGPDTAAAQASGPAEIWKGPAFYLASIIAVLVFVRVLYEIAD